MKKTIIILFLIVSVVSGAQTIYEGTAYVSTEEGTWNGVDVRPVSPTAIIFRNNSITSENADGYMLRCGSDLPAEGYVNYLDGMIISGNLLDWNGTPGTDNVHGMMLGYSINYDIKYNYVDRPYLGLVFEGTSGMTYTAGGVSYNIMKKGRGSGIVLNGQNNVPVYGNTFFSSRANWSPALIKVDMLTQVTPNGSSNNIKIKNNIFYTKNHQAVISVADSCLETLECDYNVYWAEDNDNTPAFFNITTSTYYTWAQWRALGFDAHSVNVNPNFVDTIDFVPTARLDYGTNLGSTYNTGLSTTADWVVGSTPTTAVQNGTWQVGARVFAAAASAPVAAFSANSTTITAGQSVTFTDASTNSPTSWSWTFGDAGTSSTKNPVHTYTAAGTYTVVLTATNAYGSDGETKTNYITVNAVSPSPTALFVSTTGSDAAAGTYAAPWLTWAHAFETAEAGDTVYFRGGIYPTSVTNGTGIRYNPSSSIGHDGTASEYIVYMNYPGETPILDCSNTTSTAATYYYTRGIWLQNLDYVKFKGLHIRNLNQIDMVDAGSYDVVIGWECETGNNVTFDQCVAYNMGGIGFRSRYADTVAYINCDAYNNCDSLHLTLPGSYGTGFSTGGADITGIVSYTGCRAWQCGDQGFSSPWGATTTYDNCWSFNNGMLHGGGNGFKFSSTSVVDAGNLQYSHKVLRNCLAFYNGNPSPDHSGHAFTTNDQNIFGSNATVYNCISYVIDGYGFVSYTSTTSPTKIFVNNVSYGAGQGNSLIQTGVTTNTTNTWNGGVTLTTADFLSVDSTGVTGARQADGSLPDLDFLKLVSTSDLIDAGTDVGIDYLGFAPDMGPYEYGIPDPIVNPVVILTTSVYAAKTTATVNGSVTSDGGGTISARGVCWSVGANPDLADNVVTEAGTTGAYTANITGLTSGGTYHVRAYATNESGTSYGADLQFTTTVTSFVKNGTKWVFTGNKWIRI
jgi:PKD repeat protein